MLSASFCSLLAADRRVTAASSNGATADVARDQCTDPPHPTVTTGLRPYTFSQTQYGLTALYDPQELSRYRKEHGLQVDTSARPPFESDEPPLTLLPISSGGHSPTKAAFSFLEPQAGVLPEHDRSETPIVYPRLDSQPRGDTHTATLVQSDEGRNLDLYPLYLQNPGMYQGYGAHGYPPHLGNYEYQQNIIGMQTNQAFSHDGLQYTPFHPITPSGNSAYRAPMLTGPTMTATFAPSFPRALQTSARTYTLGMDQPTMISQLAGYGLAGASAEDRFASDGPVIGQYEARHHAHSTHATQFSQAAPLQGHVGYLTAHPSSAMTSGIHPAMESLSSSAIGAPHAPMVSSANETVRTAQPQRLLDMAQDRQTFRYPEITGYRTVPTATRGGRHTSLPMQSEAFRAFEAGCKNLRAELESNGKPRQTPKKARNALRGFTKQPRGNFRK